MSNVITVRQISNDDDTFTLWGTIALSGSYVQVAGAGELLNFLTATFPAGQNFPGGGGSNMIVLEVAGSNGFTYGPAPSGTPSVVPSGYSAIKLKVSTTSAAELSAGAYPAGITSDLIFFELVIPKGI